MNLPYNKMLHRGRKHYIFHQSMKLTKLFILVKSQRSMIFNFDFFFQNNNGFGGVISPYFKQKFIKSPYFYIRFQWETNYIEGPLYIYICLKNTSQYICTTSCKFNIKLGNYGLLKKVFNSIKAPQKFRSAFL